MGMRQRTQVVAAGPKRSFDVEAGKEKAKYPKV